MRQAVKWRRVALCIAAFGTAPAHAVGLGEIQVQSYLNEPFVATVAATVSANERVTADCIRLTMPPGSDGRDVGINYLRDAEIDVVAAGAGVTLTIRSRNRVVDPVLGLVLRVDCEGSGTMLREYTALLDPRLPRELQPAYARGAPTAVAAPAMAAAPPSTGSWRVRSGESLSRIAASLAPGDRRAQARLIDAIVAANPAVFPHGDPNRLPAGALLQIPGTTDTAIAQTPRGNRARTAVPVSARGQAPAAGPANEGQPRLTLTHSEQVTDLESANETARMVAESRRLLRETESQYAETEALRARLQRLEKQIALLEHALVLAEQGAAASPPAASAPRQGDEPRASDSAAPTAAMVAPAVSPPARQSPAQVETAAPATATPQLERAPEPRSYWWWLGGLMVLVIVLLLWRLRHTAAADREERELVEWQLDQLVPAPIGAGTGGSALAGESPVPAHRETVFRQDPLADLAERRVPEGGASSGDEVPTLDHELTQRMEPQELLVETFDFEEHEVAAKPELGNVLVRAEFYQLLRQPENAIRVLREAIEGDAALNREPALWLMLLRVYRAQRLRDSFETLHGEFRQQFNIAVPNWEQSATPEEEASLEHNFPRLLERVVKLWDSELCGEFLDSLLRDDRDGTRRGFDLNIAEELLLLKGVWRLRRSV